MTIIVSSLICQNKRKQPQEQISSTAAEVWRFSPKGYPIKSGKIYFCIFSVVGEIGLFLQLLNTFLVSGKDGGCSED